MCYADGWIFTSVEILFLLGTSHFIFLFINGSCSKNAQEIITASQREGGNRRNTKKSNQTNTYRFSEDHHT